MIRSICFGNDNKNDRFVKAPSKINSISLEERFNEQHIIRQVSLKPEMTNIQRVKKMITPDTYTEFIVKVTVILFYGALLGLFCKAVPIVYRILRGTAGRTNSKHGS